jgi:RNA polymerase sigma-70 factor (ECF subfamily)
MSDEFTTRYSSDPSYKTWVQSITDRDSHSWSVLIDSFADELRRDIQRSLQKYGLSLAMVEDISQETWLTAYRNIHTFVWQGEEQFYHWLRVISCNHIHNARRHLGSERSMYDFEGGEDELEAFFETYSLQGRSVEDEVATQEQMQALVQAMESLKPEEREILVRWLMGETPNALAAEYQKPPRTISIIVWRAKRKVVAAHDHIQSKLERRRMSNDQSQ